MKLSSIIEVYVWEVLNYRFTKLGNLVKMGYRKPKYDKWFRFGKQKREPKKKDKPKVR